jgi:hypothetical protein
MPHAACAEVDADYLSVRPAHGVLGGLGSSASGDEDGIVFAVCLVGPKEVILRAPPLRILPEALIFGKIIDRWRIGIPLVEIADFLCCLKRWRSALFSSAHAILLKGRPF